MATADDYESIKALIHEYCYRIDAGDLVGVGELFADAELGASVHPSRLRGAVEAQHNYDGVVIYDDGTPHTMHCVSNITVRIDDAVFVNNHPLAGAETFTFEVFFRPDPGGAAEQRWFHLSTRDPNTGQDTDTRIMFEIRVIGGEWCLEALVNTPKGYQPLIDRSLLHPLGVWHHVAMVYDGKELRSYVNGILEQKGALEFSPEDPGHSSVGVRINRMYYFKGAVRQARFTRRALAPADFLKL